MSLDVTLISKKEQKEYSNNNTEEIEYLFTANITHNLNKMAKAAGIYEACWRPEDINAIKANDIIPILEKGLKSMKSNPEYYKKFNSPNNWGIYDDFIPWIESYLNACIKYPNAIIEANR